MIWSTLVKELSEHFQYFLPNDNFFGKKMCLKLNLIQTLPKNLPIGDNGDSLYLTLQGNAGFYSMGFVFKPYKYLCFSILLPIYIGFQPDLM